MMAVFRSRWKERLSRGKGHFWPLGWLLAPSGNALEFALRNTIASLVALGIAFWMELGSPQWAAMTVWITAQGSRGESLSKGRWRLVGTFMGMVGAIGLIAAFPQAPGLFFPALALWAGLCTGLATLLQNFRSYAFVLAAYTCAIIAIDSLSVPDHVFDIAVARGTYIALGVICELVAGVVFSTSLAVKARRVMRGWLDEAIDAASKVMSDVLDGVAPSEKAIRAVFSRTLKLNEQLEFTVVEVGRSDRAVACAYAAIGIISQIVSRGLGMQTRIAATAGRSSDIDALLHEVARFLRELPGRLAEKQSLAEVRAELAEMQEQIATESGLVLSQQEDSGHYEPDNLIILQGIELILQEYSLFLTYYTASDREALRPKQYRLKRVMNWQVALHNAVRSAVAICLAGLVWEVTAWPQGPAFVSFIAVVVSRFATVDNTVLVSNRFFYGACLAAVVSVLPVFLFLPVASGYEALIVILAPLMFIGGLAARNPATVTAAGAYNTFLPVLIGLDNHTRMDELTWFNSALALLTGLGAGVLVFRCILPFNITQVCQHLRFQAFRGLRHICTITRSSPPENHWIGLITQGMERVIRYAGGKLSPFMEMNLHGLLSVMTLGRNLIYLRGLIARQILPPTLDTLIWNFFSELNWGKRLRETVGEKLDTLIAAVFSEAKRAPSTEYAAFSEVLGCLLVIKREWHGNQIWLNERSFLQFAQQARNSDSD